MSHESRRIAGRLLLTGFDGAELTARADRALRAGERAGCILFKRNLPSAEATSALTQRIHASRGANGSEGAVLVAIDEEGGRVSRLPPGEMRLPPMRVLGAIGDVELVRDAARAVGARLASLGFNLNFAPVLDVDSNPKNPVIGDRSFGASPSLVASFGAAFASGLNDAGVLACGKHFPGHGDTDKDSHFDLPVVRHQRDRLDRIELAPFRAASRAKIDSIMSAHVVIESLDPGVPATFSHAAMTDLLRGELGFEGAVVSDDLEMRAVAALKPPHESALIAVLAGCDLLLVCKDEDAADQAHEALAKEIEKSPAFAARATEAAGRVRRMRDKATRFAATSLPSSPTLVDIMSRIDEAMGGATVVP